MKSRKQRNRTPRAFKSPGSEGGGWSGGNRKDGFSLHSGFMVRAKKADTGTDGSGSKAQSESPKTDDTQKGS